MKTRIREWRLSSVAALVLIAIAANAPVNTSAQELFQCPRGKKALPKKQKVRKNEERLGSRHGLIPLESLKRPSFAKFGKKSTNKQEVNAESPILDQ